MTQLKGEKVNDTGELCIEGHVLKDVALNHHMTNDSMNIATMSLELSCPEFTFFFFIVIFYC